MRQLYSSSCSGQNIQRNIPLTFDILFISKSSVLNDTYLKYIPDPTTSHCLHCSLKLQALIIPYLEYFIDLLTDLPTFSLTSSRIAGGALPRSLHQNQGPPIPSCQVCSLMTADIWVPHYQDFWAAALTG